jgi:diguanylate cyclase (GGDEF)-like protein
MYHARPWEHQSKPSLDHNTLAHTPDSDQFGNLLALAASCCETSYAIIDLIEGDLQIYSDKPASDEPRYEPGPIYSRIIAGTAPAVAVQECADFTQESSFPKLYQQPMRFYAARPLRMTDGMLAGTLCVLDPEPNVNGLNTFASRTLDVLAEQIEVTLNLRHAIEQRDRLIDEQRASADDLEWAATHDPLTQLPNRSAFQSCLDDMLLGSHASGCTAALLLVDIDHFKQANDILGHVGGDQVLQHYATRLRALVGPADMVARIGGDEFAILCADVVDQQGAEHLATAIARGMRLPMVHDGRAVDGRSSIGIALYPDHGADSETLTRAADLALQAAKRAGRDRYTVFDASLAQQAMEHEAILARARAAINDDRVKVHYQPIVTLDDGQVRGFEALLRWTSSSGELVLPGAWAQAFNDPQLAPAISRCVLDQVMRDVADWLAADLPFGHVAINAGTLDFSHGTFTDELLSNMALRGLPPEAIQIEVTETVLIGRSNGQVARALKALNDCGIRIALDDFGTGYASLVHLKQYPIDTVKIDRSFVAGLTRDANDRAIVKSVISLAKDLGIKSIAEGIETAEQTAFLRSEGCDYGQGFLFSAALPVDQVSNLLAQSGRRNDPGLYGTASI